MVHVFISYRHESTDARVAQRLADGLRRVGHDVFTDHSIPAGIEFDDYIGDKLKACDFFVILVTRAAHESRWVRAELRAAQELRSTTGKPRIIPLVLEQFSPDWRMEWRAILEPLNHVLCLDVDSQWDAALAKILPELGASPAAPAEAAAGRAVDRALLGLGVAPFSFRRANLISDTLKRAHESTAPLLISGLPGIGKTTLLAHAATNLAADFDHVLALQLDGIAASEPAWTLEALNDFLGNLGRALEPSRLAAKSEAQTLVELVSRMAKQAVLVLLDGADRARPAWVDTLVGTFSAAPQTRIVATARGRLGQRTRSQVVLVPPLTAAEARALAAALSAAFDVAVAPDELVDRLPEAAWSHPQALATIVAQLRDLPLEVVLEWGLPEDAQAPAAVVRHAVEALDAAARQSLALICTLGGADLTTALKALALPPPDRFVGALSTLSGRCLVHRIGGGYVAPAIVREALARVDAATALAALEQVSGAWRGALENGDDARALSTMAGGLASACRELGRWDLAARVTDEPLLEILNQRGLWKEYALLLRLGREAAAHAGDLRAQVRLGCRLARKRLQMGDLAEAKQALEEVESLVGHGEDTLERAEVLSHRALLLEIDGDAHGALTALEQSAQLRHRHGDEDGVGVTRKLAGNIHLRREDYESAVAAYRDALAALGCGPSKERVEVETGLAMCACAQGLLDDAEQYVRNAVAQCDVLRYDAGRPRTLLVGALIAERRGDLGKALELATRAWDRAKAFDPAVAAPAALVASRVRVVPDAPPERFVLTDDEYVRLLTDFETARRAMTMLPDGSYADAGSVWPDGLRENSLAARRDMRSFCLASGRDVGELDQFFADIDRLVGEWISAHQM